ncbi:MAG TPA: 4,5-DOPA dioxygenase extradiol [Pyrinomonadaceae bacterium]|nr:4,5-DOPA dioxygenase extradiol [Pyrinomonadaceae bacterium]
MSDTSARSMPALFFGHGNPMNALQQNVWTEGWSALGAAVPTPRAILCISAHWYLPATLVTAMRAPRTIHDFGGFPRELYDVQYPAPGDPELASRIRDLLVPINVRFDEQWGLDHGTWSVLRHVFPNADVPVVQLSIDETQPAEFHYETGKQLVSLRDEGVLVIGSGNLVHNLHAYAWGRHEIEPLNWAMRFEERVRKLLETGNHGPLINYETLGPDAILAAPTPDHYLPLLYIAAMQRKDDQISFPVEGYDGGSISMLSVRIG